MFNSSSVLNPPSGLRRLPANETALGVPTAQEAKPVESTIPVRPPAANRLRPLDIAKCLNGILKKICDANPSRTNLILRNVGTTGTVYLGGPNGDQPRALSLTDFLGVPMRPGEGLSFENTGEIWGLADGGPGSGTPIIVVEETCNYPQP